MAAAVLLAPLACTEEREPVAAVALATDRVEVPRGRHFSISYRFSAFPGIASLEGDHEVLVHFLDDEQRLMWRDDHFPPRPTTDWQPGEAIHYTRRVTPPLYPYVGEATIAVGLYSPSTNARLPLLADALGDRLYRGAVVTFAPRQDNHLLLYGNGWHDEEYDSTTNRRWRWTSDQSILEFRNPRSNAMLYLEVDPPPPGAVATSQRLQVRVAERVLHEVSIEPNGSRFLELPLSAMQLGDGDIVTLDLVVEPSFVPSTLGGGSTDERRLGVRVDYVYIDRD